MALTQGTKRKVCYYYDGEELRAPGGARGSRPGVGGSGGHRGASGTEEAGLRGERRRGRKWRLREAEVRGH